MNGPGSRNLGLALQPVLRLRETYSHMKIGYVVSDKVPTGNMAMENPPLDNRYHQPMRGNLNWLVVARWFFFSTVPGDNGFELTNMFLGMGQPPNSPACPMVFAADSGRQGWLKNGVFDNVKHDQLNTGTAYPWCFGGHAMICCNGFPPKTVPPNR